jgi:putative toxin-antitoxin system antitoxin component (TIGR02293 family)
MITDPVQGIARVLGGQRLLGRVRSSLDLHKRISEGLPFEALRNFARCVEVSTPQAAKFLGIPSATYTRRQRRKQLSTPESETLSRVARVLVLGQELFGSVDRTWQWLLRPNAGFDDARPIDLLRTEPGGREVEATIGRRLYGGYD